MRNIAFMRTACKPLWRPAARLRACALHNSLTASQVSQVLYGFAQFTCQDVAVLDLLATFCQRKLHLFDVDTMCQTLGAIGKIGVSSQVLISSAAARIKHMEHRSLNAVSKYSLVAWPCSLASCRRVTANSSIPWEMPYCKVPVMWP